ncbi:MAG: ParB/RepB/Spo0J family partition protein [Cumulibacter sp.]
MSDKSKKKSQPPARRGGLGRGLGALIPSGPLPGSASGKGHFWNALDNPPAVDESAVRSVLDSHVSNAEPQRSDAGADESPVHDPNRDSESGASTIANVSGGSVSAVDIHVDTRSIEVADPVSAASDDGVAGGEAVADVSDGDAERAGTQLGVTEVDNDERSSVVNDRNDSSRNVDPDDRLAGAAGSGSDSASVGATDTQTVSRETMSERSASESRDSKDTDIGSDDIEDTGNAAQGPAVSRETAPAVVYPNSAGPPAVDRRQDSNSANRGTGVGYESAAGTDDDPSAAVQEGASMRTGETAAPPAVLVELSPADIRANPKNPRQVFDDDELEELSQSIKEFGLLQPIVVRETTSGYELVMGERRLRASKLAGVDVIPVIVRQTDDDEMLRDALLENIHRVQLHPLEEAAAYQQLIEEFGVTHEELAKRIKRSRPAISNSIRLLKLPTRVQNRVAAGVISGSHARALLGLENVEAQETLAARIVAEGLSVRATEEAVSLYSGDSTRPTRSIRRTRPVAPALGALAEKLSDHFDTRATVQLGRTKGKIVVEFASVDDLERIVAMMAPPLATKRGDDGIG